MARPPLRFGKLCSLLGLVVNTSRHGVRSASRLLRQGQAWGVLELDALFEKGLNEASVRLDIQCKIVLAGIGIAEIGRGGDHRRVIGREGEAWQEGGHLPQPAMSGNLGPNRSSFGPTSGLDPIRFT